MLFSVDAFLFDLDGTLIDSTPAVERSWRLFADRVGIPFDSMAGNFHGVPTGQTVSRLMTGASQAEIDEMVAWLADVEVADVDGIVVLPGAAELLSELPPDRWAIVTSGSDRLAGVRIQAAGIPLPRKIVTSDDVTIGKPDPAPYLKGAEKLGYAPARCLAVEDAPAGVESAVASGAQVLGVGATHADLGVPQVADLSAITVTFDGDSFTVRER